MFQEASTTPLKHTILSVSDGSSVEAEKMLKTSGSMVSVDETLTVQRIGSARRTPKFTTRRSNSLKKVRTREDIGPIDMHGYLDRKQDLQVQNFEFFYCCFCKHKQFSVCNLLFTLPVVSNLQQI